jgi:hypothetical protein
MFDNHDSKRQGKSLARVVHTYEALKTHKKVCVVTVAIKTYCDLFKKTTGEQLFYKELKTGYYHVSLNAP